MVNVTEIGEMGAYVTLLEYDNIEVCTISLVLNVGLTVLFN
jgi:translation initiation factor 2 alpha subunit (eIF-2alpha)